MEYPRTTGHGSLVDAHLGNLPRVVTSRSQDTQNSDSRLMSKREVKIATVEMAISALLAVGVGLSVIKALHCAASDSLNY